jgi:methionine sulfoxide reductase heme-binding subunit
MRRKRFFQKAPVFLACLAPMTWLAWGAVQGKLGANPISEITKETGTWTLRFVVLTLAITPIRRLAGWNVLVRYRRMLGLFAFYYGTLHFLTYVWLDQFFDTASITKDVIKRPFITVGFTAFVLMVPLALTSTTGWIRRLGGKRWQALHRLVYATAVLGVVHYWWLVKADISRPLSYGALVATLLAARVVFRVTPKASPRRIPSPSVAGAGRSTRPAV